MANLLGLDALSQSRLVTDPFEYVIVRHFLPETLRPALEKEFPKIDKPGVFPIQTLRYGPLFASLLEELQAPSFCDAISQKFSVPLDGKPALITVRGRCGPRDGQVHTDSETKIITLLLYLNSRWEADGGRLRLLRSRNIEDVAVELPPDWGTLLLFRRSDRSFHGHRLLEGERRGLMVNLLTSQEALDRELRRHSRSSWIKSVMPSALLERLHWRQVTR
ncbi:MAG: 2OG-Fe(II) oxygenase [Methylacidiphilaceae bacterium]|nr:2OG-Fe(II) oxygenase [Candidatus Methylacidiphilaceae bacterium]